MNVLGSRDYEPTKENPCSQSEYDDAAAAAARTDEQRAAARRIRRRLAKQLRCCDDTDCCDPDRAYEDAIGGNRACVCEDRAQAKLKSCLKRRGGGVGQATDRAVVGVSWNGGCGGGGGGGGGGGRSDGTRRPERRDAAADVDGARQRYERELKEFERRTREEHRQLRELKCREQEYRRKQTENARLRMKLDDEKRKLADMTPGNGTAARDGGAWTPRALQKPLPPPARPAGADRRPRGSSHGPPPSPGDGADVDRDRRGRGRRTRLDCGCDVGGPIPPSRRTIDHGAARTSSADRRSGGRPRRHESVAARPRPRTLNEEAFRGGNGRRSTGICR